VLYNRGLVNAMFSVEAIRTAMQKYGKKPMTGEQVRWGLEHLRVTAPHLKALGMEDFTRPIEVTCAHHNGVGGEVYIQQWDGKEWKKVSDWLKPIEDVVWDQVKEASKNYAFENRITPRKCI
jgi:branched-chain amino acid transport system substrate-binding protein